MFLCVCRWFYRLNICMLIRWKDLGRSRFSVVYIFLLFWLLLLIISYCCCMMISLICKNSRISVWNTFRASASSRWKTESVSDRRRWSESHRNKRKLRERERERERIITNFLLTHAKAADYKNIAKSSLCMPPSTNKLKYSNEKKRK